jgi:hypothetical protein
LGQAAVTFSGEGAQEGASQGDGGIFLEQNLVAGAEDTRFAGFFCFGFPFGKFLSQGGFDETPFDAEMAQEVIDRFQLRAKPTILEVAEDGGDEGSQIVLEGEDRVSGVNYFSLSATTIFPYGRQLLCWQSSLGCLNWC